MFQGVLPPAQLVVVPARLTYSRTRSLCLSTSMVVVPPPLFGPGSYVTRLGAAPGEHGSGADLVVGDEDDAVATGRTKLAAPSGLPGVSSPLSSSVTPVSATIE